MADVSATATGRNRRQRFRAFMRRLNPTGSPKLTIEEGLIYEDPDRSVFRKMAATADLRTGSQQLVVGGVGSGKTTELLLAERRLREEHENVVAYVDVSAETDLSSLTPGALLAALGLQLPLFLRGKIDASALAESPQESLKEAYKEIRSIALGKTKRVWVDYPDYLDEPIEPSLAPPPDDWPGPGYYQSVTTPGKLKRPFPPIREDVGKLAEQLRPFLQLVRSADKELIVLFDGLDRLITADKFWVVVEQDLRSLKDLGISVLAAGPLSVMYGPGRQIKDHFDEVHHLSTVIADPEVSSFTVEVLRLRGVNELMNDELIAKTCAFSGGVLRDLIMLASNAGENAYLDDADEILPHHLDLAIEQLGKSYMLGLGTQQLTVLRKLLCDGSFSTATPENMQLLVTRRVLEYSRSKYAVHPSLVPLLPPEGGSL